jgi:hypothetical protein
MAVSKEKIKSANEVDKEESTEPDYDEDKDESGEITTAITNQVF